MRRLEREMISKSTMTRTQRVRKQRQASRREGEHLLTCTSSTRAALAVRRVSKTVLMTRADAEDEDEDDSELELPC